MMRLVGCTWGVKISRRMGWRMGKGEARRWRTEVVGVLGIILGMNAHGSEEDGGGECK